MYWDTNSVIETAYQEGLKKGQFFTNLIHQAQKMGLSNESIAELTGLNLEQIYQIKEQP